MSQTADWDFSKWTLCSKGWISYVSEKPLGFVLFQLLVKWPFVNSYLSDIGAPVWGLTLSLLPGVRAIQISAFLHASQNHRTGSCSALRGISSPVCADRGRKWSRFIAVHSSSQIQSPDAAKNESGFSDSPIRIWRLRSIRGDFFLKI